MNHSNRSVSPTPLTTLPIAAEATQMHEKRGYLLAAVAALLWGASGVIARFLFRQQALQPFDLLLIRTTLAAVLHFTLLRLTLPQLLKFDLADWWRLALFGVIGLAFNQGCYYLALNLTTVSYALLLQYTMPLMLMIYGVLTQTERLTRGKLLAGALTLAGCALMMLGQPGGFAKISVAGTLFALGSAAGFGFYTVFGKTLLAKYDARTVMAYGFAFASLAWWLGHPVWQIEWHKFNWHVAGFTVFIAAFGTVVPFGLYLASLRFIEGSRASLTATLEPVFAALLAWVALGEQMRPWQIAGGLAVLAGVLIVQNEARQRTKPATHHH